MKSKQKMIKVLTCVLAGLLAFCLIFGTVASVLL